MKPAITDSFFWPNAVIETMKRNAMIKLNLFDTILYDPLPANRTNVTLFPEQGYGTFLYMLIEFRRSAEGIADCRLFVVTSPAIYILLAAAISIDLLIFKPQYTWPGLGIVLLGIPGYFIWKNYCHKTLNSRFYKRAALC
jgi:hypothetical protein